LQVLGGRKSSCPGSAQVIGLRANRCSTKRSSSGKNSESSSTEPVLAGGMPKRSAAARATAATSGCGRLARRTSAGPSSFASRRAATSAARDQPNPVRRPRSLGQEARAFQGLSWTPQRFDTRPAEAQARPLLGSSNTSVALAARAALRRGKTRRHRANSVHRDPRRRAEMLHGHRRGDWP
jgi:hypothetical protein